MKPSKKSYMKVWVKNLLRTGMVPARAWRAHAVEIVPTEGFKLRRQMAASAGKQGATSLSFFVEAFWLSTQTWAEGVLCRQVVYRTNRSMDVADL